MNMPEKLTKCPKTPECSAKVVFRDEEGHLFRFDARKLEFFPHKCSVQNASKLPELGYCGEWYNTTTKRTRFIGPVRMRRSAETPPADKRYRQRGDNPEWVLMAVYMTPFNWRPVLDE